jgi:hypothetical protein
VTVQLYGLYRHQILDARWHDGLFKEDDTDDKEEYMFYEGQVISHMEKCNLIDCPCHQIPNNPKTKRLAELKKQNALSGIVPRKASMEASEPVADNLTATKDVTMNRTDADLDGYERGTPDDFLQHSRVVMTGKARLMNLHVYMLKHKMKSHPLYANMLLTIQ